MRIVFSFYDHLGYFIEEKIIESSEWLDWQSIEEIGYKMIENHEEYDSFKWEC